MVYPTKRYLIFTKKRNNLIIDVFIEIKSINENKKRLTKTKEKFISDAIFIHGDKYDYSLDIEGRITKQMKKDYECRCGAKKCRGTMLATKEK